MTYVQKNRDKKGKSIERAKQKKNLKKKIINLIYQITMILMSIMIVTEKEKHLK